MAKSIPYQPLLIKLLLILLILFFHVESSSNSQGDNGSGPGKPSGSPSSSSGGGGGKKGGKEWWQYWMENPQNQLWLAIGVSVGAAWMLLSSGQQSREINWQEFRTSYLEKGEVNKVKIEMLVDFRAACKFPHLF